MIASLWIPGTRYLCVSYSSIVQYLPSLQWITLGRMYYLLVLLLLLDLVFDLKCSIRILASFKRLIRLADGKKVKDEKKTDGYGVQSDAEDKQNKKLLDDLVDMIKNEVDTLLSKHLAKLGESGGLSKGSDSTKPGDDFVQRFKDLEDQQKKFSSYPGNEIQKLNATAAVLGGKVNHNSNDFKTETDPLESSGLNLRPGHQTGYQPPDHGDVSGTTTPQEAGSSNEAGHIAAQAKTCFPQEKDLSTDIVARFNSRDNGFFANASNFHPLNLDSQVGRSLVGKLIQKEIAIFLCRVEPLPGIGNFMLIPNLCHKRFDSGSVADSVKMHSVAFEVLDVNPSKGVVNELISPAHIKRLGEMRFELVRKGVFQA